MVGDRYSTERCMNIFLGNVIAKNGLVTQNMRSALSCIASYVRALSNTSDVATNDVIVDILAHADRDCDRTQ